jgi:hypothetical protein
VDISPESLHNDFVPGPDPGLQELDPEDEELAIDFREGFNFLLINVSLV